jgi:hypothetical protein
MKKLLLTVTMFLALGISSAHAIPVEFDIVDLYDWGRLYSYDGATYTPGNVNPFDGTLGNAITDDTIGQANGEEDTWGIAQIDQIQDIPATSTFFDKDVNNYELTIMFWGFDDDYLSSPGLNGHTQIGSVGGHVQIWQDFAQDYNPAAGTVARTGTSAYTGATEGLLVLDLVPIAQNAFGHTMVSGFNFNNLQGNGDLFLATTGLGAWDALYDTNTQLFGADFSFSFTSRNNFNPTVADWVVRGDGRAESNVIPEPATMFLFGTGMIGAFVRRRRS